MSTDSQNLCDGQKMGGGNTRAIAYQDFLVLEYALNLRFTILRWLDNLTVLDR